MGKILD